MCGRYILKANREQITQRFQAVPADADLRLEPRYNIAPTQTNPVIIHEDGNKLAMMHWGLVPSWSKGPATPYSTINARAETLTTKPTYRNLLRQRRCLVPATGFYEWQKIAVTGKKPITQPFVMQLAEEGDAGELFAFAGLYDVWHGPDGLTLHSYTIVTTEANPLLQPIHNRMPVILPRAAEPLWLDPKMSDASALFAWLRPYPAEKMTAYPVSPAVNNPTHDGPELLLALA